MAEGLLYVLSEPGRVAEPEFHDWYDTEHAPARLTVPGVLGADRYRAADGATPTWMARYGLRDPAVLDSPEYLRVRRRSPREQRVVDGLAVLDRRVYELLDSHGEAPPGSGPAPVVVAVGLSTSDEAGLHAWYAEEHIPLLLTLPGWWRVRRYRKVTGAGPRLLALHELADTAPFGTGTYRRAVSTPWRERVMADVTARERRVFTHHRTYPAAGRG